MSRRTKIKPSEISDGFGSVWPRCEIDDGPMPSRCGLEVVRPGKVQCFCDDMEMPIKDAATIAAFLDLPLHKVCFIVRQSEKYLREQHS